MADSAVAAGVVSEASQAVEEDSVAAVHRVDGDFDVIFVLPYAFSDHPSFPEGLLKKYLEKNGFSVGVIETPFWQKSESFGVLGKPRLFFAIISGPVDSVVLNYTSTKKRRREDLYQINNEAFFKGYPSSIKYKKRPDSVAIVFANKIREVFKDVPVIIGGVEASQRTFSHYDFQKEKIKRPILFDSRADLLVNGMGEKQIVEIAHKLRNGSYASNLEVKGTSKIVKELPNGNIVFLPEHREIIEDRGKLLKLEKKLIEAKNKNFIAAQKIDNRFIIKFPNRKYDRKEIDSIYGLNYTRQHITVDKYSEALKMNLFSVTSHRGCGGGCTFCSISNHEGKRVVSRSVESIVKEIELFKKHPKWKGVVSDVGGASAESYGTDCPIKICNKPSCLFPDKCSNLKNTDSYRQLLKILRNIKGIKKIFVSSGLRYDVLLREPQLLEDIMLYHTGKFLRVAPEHTENNVLTLMKKPSFEVFTEFYKLFNSINKNMKRKIELFPYIIIGFPGESERDIIEMKKKFKRLRLRTNDAQIFTPTPGTLATAYYYSELSFEQEKISVEKNIKKIQRRKKILIG